MLKFIFFALSLFSSLSLIADTTKADNAKIDVHMSQDQDSETTPQNQAVDKTLDQNKDADQKETSTSSSQGEDLERKVWENTKNKNWKEIETLVAPYFQLALIDGVLNKDQYFSRAKKLDIGEFTLSNFKITEGKNAMVITYDVGVTATIDDKRITSKASRLSVWEKDGNDWKWIAHAVLMPVQAKDAQ